MQLCGAGWQTCGGLANPPAGITDNAAGTCTVCGFAPMWGTVENLALGYSQLRGLPAVGCIHIPEGDVCPGEVFIAFGGPQGHADRLET
jgi:hypothetical protein